MRIKSVIWLLAAMLLLNACVGKKKFVAEQNKGKEFKSMYEKALNDLNDCRKQQARLVEDTNEKDRSWQEKAQACEDEKKGTTKQIGQIGKRDELCACYQYQLARTLV